MTLTETGLSERALERRLKRHMRKENHTFFVSCPPGFESFLETELRRIGDPGVTEHIKGGITFSGSLDWIYKVNLQSAVAGRLLLRIGSFTCKSYPELFSKSQRLDWELVLGRNPTFSFNVSATESRLHHTDNIAKAMGDGILAYYSQWPEQKIEIADKSDLTVFVRFQDDVCTVSLDTTGEHLHKRGYKPFSVEAPLRENLAAGLLIWAEAEKFPVIVDPFCGSGTFLFESVRKTSGPFPGENRTYGFEKAAFFRDADLKRIQKSIPKPEEVTQVAYGSDVSAKAIDAARKNAAQAKVDTRIRFELADAVELKNSWPSPGLIISNPPYGKRIGPVSDAEAVLGRFFHQLYTDFPGWTWCIVVPEETRFPWKTLRELKFNNGGLWVKAVMGKIPG